MVGPIDKNYPPSYAESRGGESTDVDCKPVYQSMRKLCLFIYREKNYTI